LPICSRSRVIEIENASFKSVTYCRPLAGTAITSDGLLPTTTVALTTSSLKVTISREEVTVWPKFKGFVVVVFQKPENDKTLPVYSGWVAITASTGEPLSVVSNDNPKSRFLCVFQTYMGVAAAMKDVQMMDNSDFYFGYNAPVVLDLFGTP